MSTRRILFGCAAAVAVIGLGVSSWGLSYCIDSEEKALKSFAASDSYKIQRESADLELSTMEENLQELAVKLGNGEVDRDEFLDASKEYEEKKAYYSSTKFFDDCFKNSKEAKKYKSATVGKIVCSTTLPVNAGLYAIFYSQALTKDKKDKDDENS